MTEEQFAIAWRAEARKAGHMKRWPPTEVDKAYARKGGIAGAAANKRKRLGHSVDRVAELVNTGGQWTIARAAGLLCLSENTVSRAFLRLVEEGRVKVVERKRGWKLVYERAAA